MLPDFDLQKFLSQLPWGIPDDADADYMRDCRWMQLALFEAVGAFLDDEVPVGCVIIKDGKVLAKTRNRKEQMNNPTAHAEILAITEAAAKLGSWRLEDCEVYVTLEPCSMCTGALLQARVKRLVYGARDSKAGAAGTLFSLHNDSRLNHKIETKAGCLEDAAVFLLREFFKRKR